jgi:hypothetical protein
MEAGRLGLQSNINNMSILAKPVEEPLAHKEAVKLANVANQAIILIKETMANGVPATGNNPAVPAADIHAYFEDVHLKKLQTIASLGQ